MENTLTASELKRRGMAAIDEGLARGPVRIIKRNRAVAVVLSAAEYGRLTTAQPLVEPGLTALQWLLTHGAGDGRSREEIDQSLARDLAW